MEKTLILDYDFTENQDGWFYSKKQPLVRFKFVTDEDPIWGGITTDFIFKVLKRPYFFGLKKKKKWEFIVQTNGWKEGMSFCSYILRK